MTPIRDTWEALEELYSRGLVKNIGVSNFNSQAIFDIFTYAKVKPSMLQIGTWLWNFARLFTVFERMVGYITGLTIILLFYRAPPLSCPAHSC